MRSHGGTDDVVSVLDISSPITDSLAGGILQGAGARGNGNDLGPQKLHAEHIELLALHIHSSHEHMAFHAEKGCHRGRSHAMLARASLCHHPLLAHALGQKSLAQGVVDLVGACMQQVFPLEENPGPAIVLCQPLCIVEIGGTSCILPQVAPELLLELRILFVFEISFLQLIQSRHHDFRHVLSAKLAKSALGIHQIFLIS